LVANAAYPRIAEDYARTFETLAALPADLFLGAHFAMEEKYWRLQKGEQDVFVDREGEIRRRQVRRVPGGIAEAAHRRGQVNECAADRRT
jgi:hypothetical protein